MILEKKSIPVMLAALLVLSFSLADCSRKPAEPGPGEQMTQTQAPGETPGTSGKVEELAPPDEGVLRSEEPQEITQKPVRDMAAMEASDLVDVFFEFDMADLTSGEKETLANNARFLRAAPDVRIVIEGHCDERGTNEYNLGLGERRASVVKGYLVSLGISASRIRTISYGEEKPFAVGHNEAAWKLNRRAHFELQ